MKIIVLGCGRFGSLLAERLVKDGHRVTIVDENQESFSRLPRDFPGELVVGMGIDEDVLAGAGIREADIFIAATSDDNTNIMAAQVAKEIFQVNQVIARVFEPSTQEVYKSFGLETISPTVLGVEQLEKLIGV